MSLLINACTVIKKAEPIIPILCNIGVMSYLAVSKDDSAAVYGGVFFNESGS